VNGFARQGKTFLGAESQTAAENALFPPQLTATLTATGMYYGSTQWTIQ